MKTVNINDLHYPISTIEIAELTGKVHFQVYMTTKKMLDDIHGIAGSDMFLVEYHNSQNKPLKKYVLDDVHAKTLLAKYNHKLGYQLFKELSDKE